MDYTVSANWTAFKGEFPHREVVRTGTINFPMSERVDIAGAANIASLNVAKAYDLNYRDVCATITAVTAAPRETAAVTATVVKRWNTVEDFCWDATQQACMLMMLIGGAGLIVSLIGCFRCGKKNDKKEGR